MKIADSVEEVRSVLRGLVGEYVAVGPYPGDETAEVWDADHPGRALRNRYFQRRRPSRPRVHDVDGI
jgi:hypothetical protein